jgi:hypothetical protein
MRFLIIARKNGAPRMGAAKDDRGRDTESREKGHFQPPTLDPAALGINCAG